MPVLATKGILGSLAMACFALKWAFEWKTDGWFGHTFTVGSVVFACLGLAIAVCDIATAP